MNTKIIGLILAAVYEIDEIHKIASEYHEKLNEFLEYRTNIIEKC